MSYIGKQPTKAPLTASDIEDGIITAAKIEDGAVVAAEIASNAVTTAKINADAVTGAKIADDAINSEHYTDGSVDTAHIADANITTAKIADDAVTAAKLNNDIISGTTALTSEPADTDEFLVSDAGTLKRIDYSLIKGGGITEADQWRLSASFAPNNNNTVFITSNLERADTDGAGYIGTGMSQSSGIFTFPSTGYYLITAFGVAQGDAQYMVLETHTTTDNSSYNLAARAWSWGTSTDSYHTSSHCFLFDVTNISTHKVKFGGYREGSSSHVNFNGDTSQSLTSFNFLRLGDT